MGDVAGPTHLGPTQHSLRSYNTIMFKTMTSFLVLACFVLATSSQETVPEQFASNDAIVTELLVPDDASMLSTASHAKSGFGGRRRRTPPPPPAHFPKYTLQEKPCGCNKVCSIYGKCKKGYAITHKTLRFLKPGVLQQNKAEWKWAKKAAKWVKKKAKAASNWVKKKAKAADALLGCGKHCACQSGYTGMICDFGPRISNFQQLTTEAKKMALLAVEASTIAYYTDTQKMLPTCPAISKKAKDVQVQALQGTGHNFVMQGLVSGIHHSVMPFLAFRGTDSVKTIIQDMRFKYKSTKIGGTNVKVHKGFHEAISKNWKHIVQHAKRVLGKKRRRILITGHSLGGAMAAIATAMLKNDDAFQHVTFDLITLGAPRAGNYMLAGLVEKSTRMCYRLVNGQKRKKGVSWDVVATSPSGVPNAGAYTHAGNQINLGIKDGTKRAGFPAFLKLHSSTLYLDRAKQLVGKEIREQSMCTKVD